MIRYATELEPLAKLAGLSGANKGNPELHAMQQQSMDLAKEERRAQRLAVLDAALKRMDEDEFAYCLRCGEDIPSARLDVDPAVTLCVDCVG